MKYRKSVRFSKVLEFSVQVLLTLKYKVPQKVSTFDLKRKPLTINSYEPWKQPAVNEPLGYSAAGCSPLLCSFYKLEPASTIKFPCLLEGFLKDCNWPVLFLNI